MQLKLFAGAYHFHLCQVERMQGWSMVMVIYSFMDKRALLSAHKKREVVVKVVRVKNSPYVALKNVLKHLETH